MALLPMKKIYMKLDMRPDEVLIFSSHVKHLVSRMRKQRRLVRILILLVHTLIRICRVTPLPVALVPLFTRKHYSCL